MRIILSLGIFCILAANAFAQNTDLLLAGKIEREKIFHHKAFSLSYNTAHTIPNWISYKVTSSEVSEEGTYKAKYLPDPSITTRAATKKDYKDIAGYTMGQLVNYLDISHIEGAAEESFYMSNIVPMKPAFHKHIWLKTDKLVRMWVNDSVGLYVFCGPIIESPFRTIGKNKVYLPKRYYKVVYDAENKKAVAFLVRNGSTAGTLKSYSCPVSKIEEETGINFLPELPEEEAKTIKSAVDYGFWQFEIDGKTY